MSQKLALYIAGKTLIAQVFVPDDNRARVLFAFLADCGDCRFVHCRSESGGPRVTLSRNSKYDKEVKQSNRTTMGSIGIPIKLLHESQGHVVTLELNNGQTYRGKLFEAEDNMNVQLKDITVTARDGRVSHLDQVYIRGSHVRFFIVPDMLRYAAF
ncbi:hypothetical protein G7K_0086-t1 [Saitoella complicata NRRL Y-17804]|uniref:Small nuclear ribonucleoprotein Sm D3 n=1 Tax=Saitoella complicata (strain BCRC 22490 / CBS 7301 / JCM 7358 / NBRC 10748 / NRRL Y-17804) TaxID=698492 RepID=A0A0E9N7C5_SAICN|nr:hypothetical protein G7K_0086-t1 [Saitoella complicata NRRL Y-17804]